MNLFFRALDNEVRLLGIECAKYAFANGAPSTCNQCSEPADRDWDTFDTFVINRYSLDEEDPKDQEVYARHSGTFVGAYKTRVLSLQSEVPNECSDCGDNGVKAEGGRRLSLVTL